MKIYTWTCTACDQDNPCRLDFALQDQIESEPLRPTRCPLDVDYGPQWTLHQPGLRDIPAGALEGAIEGSTGLVTEKGTTPLGRFLAAHPWVGAGPEDGTAP